ncbi:MAG TPA: translation elongation factor Ts [bacterium]|nr:translation elongation factor Ts [bacterium]
MAVTMEQIKTLRERTLVGFADCKNALTEADGDMDKAIELLRKKGIAKAAKRAENETSEGKIKMLEVGGTTYVVSVSCETDFVARNDVFDGMLAAFLDIRKAAASDAEAMEKAEILKTDYVLKIGENFKINLLTAFSGEIVASYVHSNGKVASVVVAKSGTDMDKLRQVAMHVTATAPEVLRPEDISDEAVAREKDIALAQMQEDPKNAGKPAEILEKIIDGKMKKFREENALLTQAFVVNPEQTVGQAIGMDSVISFARFAI